MKISAFSYTSGAASIAGMASNVTGAGPWTMGVTNAGDGCAHKVTVRNDAATDHHAKTLTLTGTDANGAAQTETLAAPNTSATVTSTKYYLTLTTVAIDATIGTDTFDVGWAVDSITPWHAVDGELPISVVGAVTGGSPTFTVQYTVDGSTAVNHGTIASKTATTDSSITTLVRALRLLFAADGAVTVTLLQPETRV